MHDHAVETSMDATLTEAGLKTNFGNCIHQLEHLIKVDPVNFCSTWLDENNRVIFSSHAILNLLAEIKHLVPSDLLNNIGGGWQYLDGIMGYFSAFNKFRKLPDAKRRQHEKAAWVAHEVMMSTIVNTATTLTLLSQFGALTGVTAAACLPLASLSIAAALWGTCIHSYIKLDRERKKYTDPIYHCEDLLTQYENIKKKINKLNAELAKLDPASVAPAAKQRLTLAAKVTQWEMTQQQLKVKITLLASENSKRLPKTFPARFEKCTGNPLILSELTSFDRKLLHELEKNQKENLLRKSMNSIALTTSAIGMTLCSIAPFTGPLAPAVFAAGVAMSILGGTIKLIEFVGYRAVNYIAKRAKYNSSWEEIIRNKHKIVDDHSMDKLAIDYQLNSNDAFCYALSYSYNKTLFAAQNPTWSDSALQHAWYEKLQSLKNSPTKKDKKIWQQILDKSKDQTITDHLLSHALRADLAEGRSKYTQALSEKDKQQIIDRECRHCLTAKLTTKFSLFKTQVVATHLLDANVEDDEREHLTPKN